MLTTTNLVLTQSAEAISALLALKLPVKIAYRLAKIARKLQKALDVYGDTRKALIDRHTLLDDDNKPVPGPTPDAVLLADPLAFAKDAAELDAITIEFDFEPLPLALLGDSAVEPRHLYVLDWLITETEPAPGPA